jgi:hypothetical protein
MKCLPCLFSLTLKTKTGKYFIYSAVVLSPQVPPTGHVLGISLIKNCCPDCILKHMCKMKENLQTWPVGGGGLLLVDRLDVLIYSTVLKSSARQSYSNCGCLREAK